MLSGRERKKYRQLRKLKTNSLCKWLVRLLLNWGKAFRFVRFEIFGFAGVYTLKPFLDSTVYTIPDSCFVSKQQNESGAETSRVLVKCGNVCYDVNKVKVVLIRTTNN